MLRSLLSLKKSVIESADGLVGEVEDFLFDDDKWTVRYLIINTGTWLTGRKVLISPIAIKEVDRTAHAIRVSLTQYQIIHSPEIDTDKPVSRQHEIEYHDYYQWPIYWGGPGIWGLGGYPSSMLGRPYPMSSELKPSFSEQTETGDLHLRSTKAVHGYKIHAKDKTFGHVSDFIVDDETWTVRYLVVDTKNFFPSASVIIAPEWVDSINWDVKRIGVNLTEEQVKKSAEYHADDPINRKYEENLYDYYGRPRYWDRPPIVAVDEMNFPKRRIVG